VRIGVEHLEARPLRQHQVEQHQVEVPGEDLLEAAAAGHGEARLEARPPSGR
jgi:hypothetical protein